MRGLSPTTGDTFRNISIFSGGILKPAAGSTVVVHGQSGGDSFRLNGGSMDANGGTFKFTSPDGGGVYGRTFHDVEVTSTAASPDDSNDIYISGNNVISGTLRRSHAVVATGPLSGGLAGAAVEVVVQGTLASLAVDRIGSVPNARTGHQPGASWTFDVGGATGYSVDLTLPHAIAIPSNAAVSRYVGPGINWDYVQNSSTANTVTRTGIADLSSVWAIADLATTPMVLDAFAIE